MAGRPDIFGAFSKTFFSIAGVPQRRRTMKHLLALVAVLAIGSIAACSGAQGAQNAATAKQTALCTAFDSVKIEAIMNDPTVKTSAAKLAKIALEVGPDVLACVANAQAVAAAAAAPKS